MANNRLDIIVFGATGFTGQYAVKYAAHFCKEWQLKFGIAGRRKEALEAVLKEFAPDAENVPIILADVNDETSLKKMTESTKVLVNCCGPYRLYGEPVVKTCIATHTHHVDVSGEPWFIESMQLLYNKAAQEAGVYIVSACGYDSIPVDLGIIFAQRKFGGEINSVETYVEFKGPKTGPMINYGTWESAVYGLAQWNELRGLRAKLYPKKLPEFTPKLESRGMMHKSDIVKGWSTLFLGSDRSVAMCTQRFLYEKYNERPAQVRTYLRLESFFTLMTFFIVGMIFWLMVRTSFTRKLLLKYPTLFSGGAVGHGNMTHKSESARSSITFRALGWSEKLANPTDKHTDPPNKELITKLNDVVDPAYRVTCTTLVLSAIMILKEADKMPDNGGVLSPGAAFGKTSLIEEMDKNDIKFEVIKCIEK
ncbi:saccharopine dehydrogenase-like oxidoreductase [Odontomachus brunneus]|uniref:saccharopine dehydrogenase-like oxidoreductase n=1 Tax=Odontomachus brunneus TaxID=486640 RepID=UPI0013F18726|nr:saccharopine dehydrogenase-like oxidoreductase [Odontomachus brunneus]XP_032673155.1 saccharopine dehydrogenase-like oxidoreductase [Odontomachus brunneus]